jgi:predicted metal-dependent phosphoesterase TrpH
MLKADLHVHSYHSGYAKHLPFFRTRDSYSTPEEIYRQAKSRGMDLVTITDHNSIDGCLEFLERFPDAPDFFIGEEIDCALPDTSITVHVGALGIDEIIHREVQSFRDNVFEVTDYLRHKGVAFTLNHPFHFFRDQIKFRTYLDELIPRFPAVEVRNGTMLRCHNDLVSEIVERYRRRDLSVGRVGGSDAHILSRVGMTYTEVPARNRDEFLAQIRCGRARGRHGSTATLAAEIYGVIFNYWGSLLGLRGKKLELAERLSGIGYSLLSIPFQAAPIVVAVAQKRDESVRVARWRR